MWRSLPSYMHTSTMTQKMKFGRVKNLMSSLSYFGTRTEVMLLLVNMSNLNALKLTLIRITGCLDKSFTWPSVSRPSPHGLLLSLNTYHSAIIKHILFITPGQKFQSQALLIIGLGTLASLGILHWWDLVTKTTEQSEGGKRKTSKLLWDGMCEHRTSESEGKWRGCSR